MGTWGEGNFDSDGALDYMGGVIGELSARIDECFADEEGSALDEGGEAVLMPSVAMISVLCEHCRAAPPTADVVEGWKQQYLAIYDAQIDDLLPQGDYKVERRKVIEDTFNRLQAQASNFWKEIE